MEIYQAGLGEPGRHVFEKFVEMYNHLEQEKVEIKGVYSRDFELLDKASTFARANNIDIKEFQRFDEMVETVDRQKDTLLFDSVPSYSFMKKAVSRNMVYVAERPDVKRIDMLERVKELENGDVGFLDTGSMRFDPLVLKARELLEDEKVESARFFTENTEGVERIVEGKNIPELNGGNFWRNVPRQVAMLETILEDEVEVGNVETRMFTPRDVTSDYFLSVEGSKNDDVYSDTATGADRVSGQVENVDLEMASSWLGLSDECRKICGEIEELTGHSPVKSWIRSEGSKTVYAEEADFLVVEGSRHLLVDVAGRKIFDIDTGEEVEVSPVLHSPAYMFLERTVMKGGTGGDLDIYLELAENKDLNDVGDGFEMLEEAKEKMRENLEDKVFVEDIEA